MKEAVILKTAGGQDPTPEQLARINGFSRRALTADEVYVFSLVLCDNEVDREYERFPVESLEALAKLFIGKTGIFDHNPKGQNQTARIFETRVERDEKRLNRLGEPYCALRAGAYMVRCEKNADLILEIDAGIKKEVSVGCAVEKSVCSVCGANTREKPCSHRPGKTYNGVLCLRELVNPTDAYEWSFVAVPAQRQAGVTKGYETDGDLLKALETGGVTLDGTRAKALAGRLRALEELSREGERRTAELRKRFVAASAFALPGMDGAAAKGIADKLSAAELQALCGAMEEKLPPALQLCPRRAKEDEAANDAFVI